MGDVQEVTATHASGAAASLAAELMVAIKKKKRPHFAPQATKCDAACQEPLDDVETKDN